MDQNKQKFALYTKHVTKNVTTSGQLLSISDQFPIKQNQLSLDANQCIINNYSTEGQSSSSLVKSDGSLQVLVGPKRPDEAKGVGRFFCVGPR